MRDMRARSTSMIVEIAGNACAAVASVIRISHHQTRGVRIATPRHGRERRCVDSESRILAMKKFSCLTPISPLAAGRTVAFLRIAVGDSRDGGSSRTTDRRRREPSRTMKGAFEAGGVWCTRPVWRLARTNECWRQSFCVVMAWACAGHPRLCIRTKEDMDARHPAAPKAAPGSV